MKRTYLLILYLFIVSFSLSGQSKLSGQVTDERGKPLAFVNILVNGDNRNGEITDIDGLFSFDNIKSEDELHLSYLGYESLIYKIKNEDFENGVVIELKNTSYKFEEVTVIAGENPAHRIIKNVVANRNKNNPDKYFKYSCKTYNKMRFGTEVQMDLYEKEVINRRKSPPTEIQQENDQDMRNRAAFAKDYYLAIMESVTEKQFIYPNFNKEVVLHNKVSGLKEPNFVALAKDVQPFSFYLPQISILDEVYINPISKGSTKIYYFNWTDTLINGQDTTFIITFQPKKGRTFEGLKGVLYIHSNQYAIRNVIAEPADKMQSEIRIEQKYIYHEKDEKWFPEQLNMEWLLPKYPDKYVGLRVIGKSYIKEVDFQPSIKPRDFTKDKYEMANGVFDLEKEGWKQERSDTLSQKELASYDHIDSLSQKYKFEQILDLTTSGVSADLKLGIVDLDIDRLLGFNSYENFRLGIGFHTNDDLIKNVSIGGYGAYGWRDKAFKYGGDIRWNIPSKSKFYIEAGYINDLKSPGQLEIPRWQTPFSATVLDLFQPVMDSYENIYAEMGSRFFKYGNWELKYADQTIQPNGGYVYTYEGEAFNQFNFQETQLGIRYAYGEQTVTFMGIETPEPTKYPIFHARLTAGQWEDANVSYQKLVIGLEQEILLHRFGSIEYNIEAGMVEGDVPWTKLLNSRGLGIGYRTLTVENTFQTMQPNEFLSDRFAQIFFRYNIGTLSKAVEFSQPALSLVHNQAWGTLQNADNHSQSFKTLEQGYFESGVELNDLYRMNYLNIAYLGVGFGTYLRHGTAQLDGGLQSNLSYRLLFNFSL